MSTSPVPKSALLGQIEPFPGREVAQDIGAELTREQKRTAALKGLLPRGVSIGFRSDGREKPWFVRFGPDRTTESFKTERLRNDRAEKLAAGVSEQGTAVLDFDPAEWRQLQLFKQRTGITLAEAEEIVLRVRGNLKLNLTAAEATQRFMALRIEEGLPKLSQNHPRLHLTRFCDCTTVDTKVRFGALPLFTLNAEHVRHWLNELKKQGFGPVTRRHHRKNLNVFFERALLEKWCVENPCSAVVPPKVPDQTTPILTPAEIFRLLKANREFAVVGRLVYELFGGLRCASVERLEESDVNQGKRGIQMRGSSIDAETDEWDQGHKSGVRKFRQGHPSALWAWVEHCWPLPQPESGPPCFADVTEKNYDERKKAAFVRAGWEEVPHNRLRHCFASYLLALTKDRRLVSYLMQHSNWKMLDRYEGVAEEQDARLVMAMTPAAVLLTWEEFSVRWEEFYQPMPTLAQ